MRSLIEPCVLGSLLICCASALHSQKPVLRPGVSVEMPVATHAVEVRAAAGQKATVVAVTAGGKVFVGIEPTGPAALSKLSAATVYVKADSRVPYQSVVAVLDALRGKTVVLITARPDNSTSQGYVAPYGMKLRVSR